MLNDALYLQRDISGTEDVRGTTKNGSRQHIQESEVCNSQVTSINKGSYSAGRGAR